MGAPRKYATEEEYKRAKHRFTKRWFKQNPEYNRMWKLQTRFGMTLEEYDELFDGQGGVCAICGGSNPDGRRLAVDHDHETGEIRGLLCYRCNRYIVGIIECELGQNALRYLGVI